MWSPYYKYYQIIKDKNRSEKIEIEKAKSILSSVEFLEQDGLLIYKNQSGFPWITITLIETDDGNYSVNDTTRFENINLLEVITSRRPETNEQWYLEILKNLANQLRWQLILEEDDDGKENVLINSRN